MSEATAADNQGTIDALVAQVQKLTVAVERLIDKKSYDDNSILTVDELAEALKLSPQTIWRYCKLGLPSFEVAGGAVRYRYGDVLAWLQKSKRRLR